MPNNAFKFAPFESPDLAFARPLNTTFRREKGTDLFQWVESPLAENSQGTPAPKMILTLLDLLDRLWLLSLSLRRRITSGNQPYPSQNAGRNFP